MKSLLILRHGKSDWSAPGLSDHDRPLKKRGKRDAPKMGKWILEQDIVPQLILSSTAKRARKTAKKAARACNYEGDLQLVGELYMAPPDVYVSVLRALDDELQRVMVVGHNPGLQNLVTELTGEEETMPTAALAHVQFDISRWTELAADKRARLLNLWRPRELP